MSEKDWEKLQLRDAATKVGSGATPTGGKEAYHTSGIPLIRSQNVRFEGFAEDGLVFLDASQAASLDNAVVWENDILLNITGASIGRVTLAPPHMDGARVNQHVTIVRLKDQIDPSFVRWFIASPSQQRKINSIQVGVTRQALTKDMVLRFELPLPPFGEQKRIVAKIEELFSDLDAGVAALKRAKANLKRYRAAVLKAAVEGKLTEEWRVEAASRRLSSDPKTRQDAASTYEPASALLARILKERRQKWEADQLAKFAAADKEPLKNWRDKYVEPAPPNTSGLPELPKNWCWVNIEMVADSCLGKMLDKSKHLSGTRLPYLRNTNVRWGSFMVTDLLEMYFKDDELERFSLLEGDVLVCEGGEPGRCAVWGNQIEGMKFQKALHRVRCSDGLQPWYLTYFLEHMAKSLRLEQYFTGTTIKHFTGESFAKVPIPLPPFIEQQQIVEEVAEKLSQIEALDSEIEHGLLRAARLRQSILKQAFEGKLVPQDPKDEPASVLLDRLRASRSAHEVNGKAATPARTRGRRAKSKQVSLPGEEGER